MIKNIFEQAKKDLESIGIPDARGKALRIIRAYISHTRHYHHINPHIDRMIFIVTIMRSLFLSKGDALVLRFLTLYHDVWLKINVNRGVSEHKSTDWALADVNQSSKLDSREVRRLRRILKQGIPATITHTLDEVDRDLHEIVSLFLDLDLQGLGASPEQFKKDTELLWLEHNELPNASREIFNKNTSNWAEIFLNRNKIYHSPYFTYLEKQARTNLASLVIA